MLPIAFLPPPLLYLEAPTWSRRFAMCKLVRGASIYSKGREKEQWDGVGPIGTASMEISKSVVGFVENWERGGPGQSPPLPFRMERVKTTEFFFFFFNKNYQSSIFLLLRASHASPLWREGENFDDVQGAGVISKLMQLNVCLVEKSPNNSE